LEGIGRTPTATYDRIMGIALAFLSVAGVPFLAAVGIDSIGMPRFARAAVVASVPVAAVFVLSRPLDLTGELGLPLIACVVLIGWLFGFATAPLIRALLVGVARLAKP
jgi:hypothetical protein